MIKPNKAEEDLRVVNSHTPILPRKAPSSDSEPLLRDATKKSIPSSDTNELDITARKVLYILETRKTIPSDWTSTQVNEMYAKMIAHHIHKYFELKGDI